MLIVKDRMKEMKEKKEMIDVKGERKVRKKEELMEKEKFQ